MRVAIVSKEGTSLPWWKRLQDEGHDVAVWIKDVGPRQTGDGIIPKAGSWPTLLEWAKVGQRVGQKTIVFFDFSGLGELAEHARDSGLAVVGGCKFADRLEKDRLFGFDIAKSIGCKLPKYEWFESFDACLRYARKMSDKAVYFKSNRFIGSDATHGCATAAEMVEYLEWLIRNHGGAGACMLQDKVEGVAVSTARWWNGRSWVGPYEGTIEHKPFMNGDVGPGTGCAINTVWFYESENPYIAREQGWDRLASVFTKYNAAPGIYDINSVVAPNGDTYFLEWTPRLGYDSEMTSFRLFPDLGKVLHTVAYGTGDLEPSSEIAYATRVTVPPYPWDGADKNHNKTCVGTYISQDDAVGDLWSGGFVASGVRIKDGILEVAVPDGYVGVAYGQSRSFKMAVERAEKAAKALMMPGKQYRTDGFKTLVKDAKKARSAGLELPPGMVD